MQKNIKYLGSVATAFSSLQTGSWRIIRPVYFEQDCIKCGICVNSCPLDIISLEKDKQPYIKINYNYCKGCGICANECPKECLIMQNESEWKDGI